MKLNAEHEPVRDCRVEGARMRGRGDDVVRAIGDDVVGMREVEVAVVGHAREQRDGTCRLAVDLDGLREVDRVPAHVRHLQLVARGVERLDAHDVAGQDAEALHARARGAALVAPLEQQVQPQADPQKRRAGGDGRADGICLPRLVHGGHGVGKRADARQDDAVSAADGRGVIGDTITFGSVVHNVINSPSGLRSAACP